MTVARAFIRQLDQDLVAQLGNVDGDKRRPAGVSWMLVMTNRPLLGVAGHFEGLRAGRSRL
ncbi:hypothetical protein ACFQU7_41955 [Pseudoroseomonas wenyumeiae]